MKTELLVHALTCYVFTNGGHSHHHQICKIVLENNSYDRDLRTGRKSSSAFGMANCDGCLDTSQQSTQPRLWTVFVWSAADQLDR